MTIHSTSEQLIEALGRSAFGEKLIELGKMESKQGKFGCGYKGTLINIASSLQQSISSGAGYGAWLKSSNKEAEISTWLSGYLGKGTGSPCEDIAVVHSVTKPQYNLGKLPTVFAQFFAET